MKIVNAKRSTYALMTGACLSLSLLGLPTSIRAQDDAGKGQSKEGEKGKEEKGTEKREKAQGTQDTKEADSTQNPKSKIQNPDTLPLLLLVVQRPQGMPARQNDINASLSMMLRSTLRESRHYQVILYSADHPSIRRALLEHAIAATDLVEPIKPESMQKLAQLLGARYILMVSTALDKVGLKTDTRLMQDTGQDMDRETWITPRSEPIIVDAQFGKLRLKNDQLLALTVDSIDGFLGIPSHLATNIHLGKTKLIGKPVAANTKDRNAKDKNAKGKDNPDGSASDKNDTIASIDSDAGGSSKQTSVTVSGSKNDAQFPVKPAEGGAGRGDSGRESVSAAPDKASSDKPPAKSAPKPSRSAQIAKNDQKDKNARVPMPVDGEKLVGEKSESAVIGSASNDAAAPPRQNQPAIVGGDAGAALLAEPKVVPPVPLADNVNLENSADRYRRVGDLSNSIAMLRQAINASPRDIHLRKKLILAYQDRQLLDQAQSEAERAMQIDPADADLSRLYANCLTAKGDTTAATKLLRDLVTANPKNTAAQVALGDALLSDSQYADALKAYEAAAANDPKSPLPHRRLARVAVARAGSDPAQYAVCLQEVAQARSLTPPTDTQTYQSDYIEIMLLLESRLKDMLDQTNETYNSVDKRAPNDLQRAANDLNERAESASNFLEKLPPAAGQETTHAHYEQGAALLVQATGYLRKYLKTNDMQIGQSLRGTRVDALSEFANAHTRLTTARTVLEKGNTATGATSAN
jgi:tetratricopeptide (TPR) repeat protein